jgi:hypothetical protein
VNSKEVIVIIVTVIGSVVGGDAIDINAPKRIGENKQLLLAKAAWLRARLSD